MRKELEEMRDNSNGRFKLFVSAEPAPLIPPPQYCLNKPPAGWTGGVGFVTQEMIEKFMPPGGVGSPVHGEGHKVLMCGPPPMINAMK
jgi:cytochrome-b5 reductase